MSTNNTAANLPPKPRTKHAALVRPDLGEFGRYELAILGAPCGKIKDLVARLLPHLAPALSVGYVDADHAGADADEAAGASPILQAGATAELTDKIQFRRLDQPRGLDKFSQQEWLAHQSLVLVNGNHFRAKQQLIILDPAKPLDRKLDRLTDVQLILRLTAGQELPEYLRAHLPDADRIPVLDLSDTPSIAAFIRQWWQASAPPLRGLVLAGGQSQRMQTDKGRLRYHGQEQRAYAAELLAAVCRDVHVSCRPDQVADFPATLQPLPDRFLDLGPLGGILSAFQLDPNAAWLVVACDLPFLSADTLQHLVAHRQPGKMATAFQSPHNDFPEPLITIWEPGSYAALLRFLSLGYSCPRKALINSDVAVLKAPDARELRNVNTPEEREAAERELGADIHL
ncbi:Molybdopterin-guanine dinucleotide biosynthesis protein A-like [Hymenobacter roseosalivarius DSM 11622]|uniref:Probable molybdenum cofactor guanylyltransferase n=1 Tax=Hymenobacter roseosalivarius DSM 11622 TaxID=645990 RepID=A0A1W1UVK5_9BACT|nr:NTP transferase domain-containing protein [Hymenobacter roseosalivarius]SMB84821.1 Molybdopterin-guanine dinucleotide biosynthesis protein A-like [Hymenobacter roseosalivarius DSM 11622]